MNNLYETIANRIIAQMEAGTPPWVKEWSSGPLHVPMNAVSNRPYSGINVLLFWAAEAKGYANARYLTFRQAKECGGTVRAGEHGTQVIYFKQLTVKVRSTGDDKTIPMLRAYTVFNVAQCDNLPDHVVNGPAAKIRNLCERVQDAEEFVRTTGAVVQEGKSRAAYSPALDMIGMPAFAMFKDAPSFYSTLFHELTHWTGHKSRLDRDLSTRFVAHAYALEELVAELGAAFLSAEFGFDLISQHAAYLQSWIKACKDNPRALFTAASKASAAAEYLRSKALAAEEVDLQIAA